MAVPIVKQKVGVVNVEALKRVWHSISRACAVCILEKGLAYRRAISMAGRALASSQLDGCNGPFRMSASTWTRLLLSEALFWEENCRSAVVLTCLVFKIAFNEADDTVFCFTCRKMFKEKKNKTSTKADPAFVSSSL